MLQPKDTSYMNGYKNKTHPYVWCLKEHFRPKAHIDWIWEDGKIYFMQIGNQKQAVIGIFISDKIDLKIKDITRYKEGHYLIVKGSIQEEDITIVNIYAPNIGAPQ